MGAHHSQVWRILHIDDDEDDYILVKTMLNQAQGRPLNLEWAATLEEGRQKLCTNHYHAVLVDYDMGDGTGIELIRELVKRDYPAPLILLTGRGSYEVDVEAMRAGATLYLTKTEINPLLLERSIRYAVERKQAEQALLDRDRKLSVALDAAQLGTWVYHFENHQFEMDARAQEMYRADQNVESHDSIVEKHLHPDDVPGMWTALSKAADAAGDGRYQAEYRIFQPDGSMIWLNARGLVEFEGEGSERQAARLVGASRDITEQLRLQEENRQQTDLLERLVQSAPAGIAFVKGPQHVYTLVNAEYERIGRGKGQLIGRSVADVWPEIAGTILPQLDRVYRTGEPFSMIDAPLTIERKGALEEDFFTYTFTPIYRADRTVEGVMILAIETTAAVYDRRAVEAQSARLKAVLHSLPVGVWITDEQGRVVETNPMADTIWAGKVPSSENVEGYIEYLCWWPDSGERVKPYEQPIAQVLDLGGAVTNIEMDIQRGDGSRGTILSAAAPVNNAEGRMIGVVGLAQDITERKQAEQALRESEERFIKAFEASPNAIVISRPEDGRIETINSSFERLFGYERQEVIGRKSTDLNMFANAEERQAAVRRLKEAGMVRNFELDILTKAGELRNASLSVSMITVGQEDAMVTVIEDITERRRAEEALRESKQRYLSLFHAKTNAIAHCRVITDEQGRPVDYEILQVNDAYEQITGIKREQIEGRRAREVFPGIENFAYDYIGNYGRVALQGGELNFEIFFEALQLWLSIYIYSPKPGEFTAIFTDISQRKQAELALGESEARFRQLADAMPQLVWTAQPDGRVDYYNKRYQLYGGIAPLNDNHWEWGPVLHPDDLKPTLEAWNRAVNTGEVYQIEHRVHMADGSFRWHLSRGIPVHDEMGSLIKWYGTATDIGDFKQIQETLMQREQRLQQLFESSLIGIVSRDPFGKVVEANDAYLEIIGYSCKEVEAGLVNTREITPPEYHLQDHQYTEQVLAQGFCKPYEKEYIRKDGTRVPVMIGYSLVEGEQPEFIGFVLDLSELKQAQADLTQYADKLKRSNEELENFAFMASHDLQEPLRKILWFSTSLRRRFEDQLSEEVEEYLDRMQNAAGRMQAMIEGLLDLSRVNTRGSEFELVDLTTIAREVVLDLERSISSTHGRVIVEQLPVVEGDALQLRQLLHNLVGNGLKYHQEGIPPVVRISGEQILVGKNRQARIVVEDNGIGFEEENADRIFQPFIRLHGRNFEGSGIGLSICRKIVERHGGGIHANSQPGEGSRFTITLPLSFQTPPH